MKTTKLLEGLVLVVEDATNTCSYVASLKLSTLSYLYIWSKANCAGSFARLVVTIFMFKNAVGQFTKCSCTDCCVLMQASISLSS